MDQPARISRRFGALLVGLAAVGCSDSNGVAPEGPRIEIQEPTAFTFEVEQGRDAPSQITRITNAGDATLNWVASSSDEWLSARPASGSLREDEGQDLGISVQSSGVAPGEYSGTVRISSADDPTLSQSITVRMTVLSLLSEVQGTLFFGSDRQESSCDVTCPLDVYAMNGDGSDLRRLTVTAEVGVRSSGYPDVSKDGEWVAFRTSERGTGSIRLMNGDGSDPITVFEPAPGGNAGPPSLSQDGRWIAFSSQHSEDFSSFRDVWLASVDGTEVVPVTRDLPWHPYFEVDFSPDGERILHQREGGDLWVVDVDGTDAVRLVEGPVLSPRWSPDGTRIAYSLRGDGETDARIYIADADGSDPTPLVAQPGMRQLSLSWSPDGSRIVFQTYDGFQADLWSARADGTGLVQITDTPHNEVLPSWGPEP